MTYSTLLEEIQDQDPFLDPNEVEELARAYAAENEEFWLQ